MQKIIITLNLDEEKSKYFENTIIHCGIENLFIKGITYPISKIEVQKEIIEDNDEDYKPYCKNCSSCGEDGCCSYLSCIRHAVVNNKGCTYPNTYLEEVFLRDAFLKLCFEHMNKSKEITDFIENMYDKAYEDLVNYVK